jgi:hypothetical protein
MAGAAGRGGGADDGRGNGSDNDVAVDSVVTVWLSAACVYQ